MIITERRWSAQHLLILAVVAGLVLLALYRASESRPRSVPLLTGPIVGSDGQSSVKGALVELNQRINGYVPIAQHTNDWSIWATLAQSYLARARLTGHYDDYVATERALTKSFALAAKGAGPYQLQAGLGFATHRLADAETALDAIDQYVLPDPPGQRAEQVAMRGDIALYRGDYATASRRYRESLAMGGTTTALCRMAYLSSITGQPDAALSALEKCEAAVRYRTPQFASNIAVARGNIQLARGKWAEATQQFDAAERLFPGLWSTQMRRAQLQILNGDQKGGVAALEAIANATGNPEPMDILAGIARAGGNDVRAAHWIKRAGTIWQTRLSLLPEASYGHALEHELDYGDANRALTYAARNVRARPYGEAYFWLAQAWMANGRPDYAIALGKKMGASGWDTVQQHVMLANAYSLSGKPELALAERQLALARNPNAFDPRLPRLRLDH